MPLSTLTGRRRRAGETLAFLAVIAAAIGPGAAGTPLRTTAACIDAVRYQGKLYQGTFVGRALRRAARVRAVRPGCNDTPGSNERDAPVTVTQALGIAPSLALLAADNARHLYLVSGVFPENPNHPLHIALYGNRARPNECLGARALGSVRVRGTVAETPLAFDLVPVRGTTRITSFIVDAWTHFGFAVTHRLVKGARVDVRGVRCLKPNTTSPVVVARRIDLR